MLEHDAETGTVTAILELYWAVETAGTLACATHGVCAKTGLLLAPKAATARKKANDNIIKLRFFKAR
jgi:hypothetical protein